MPWLPITRVYGQHESSGHVGEPPCAVYVGVYEYFTSKVKTKNFGMSFFLHNVHQDVMMESIERPMTYCKALYVAV